MKTSYKNTLFFHNWFLTSNQTEKNVFVAGFENSVTSVDEKEKI